MRKIVLITFMTAIALILNATNEFHGQWYLLATGMPQGDMKMLMVVDCNSYPPHCVNHKSGQAIGNGQSV